MKELCQNYKSQYDTLLAMLLILSYYWLWESFQSITELLLKKKSKKIRVNHVTDSYEKHNNESESQRGVVLNKPTRKNKNRWIGRGLPLVLDM